MSPQYLPTRYTLDGELEPEVDDWPNFQLDGYGTWLWALLAWLIEGRGIVKPLQLFILGGSNVLLAYLLAPLWAHFLQLAGLTFYGRFGQISVAAGITRSLLLATVILWIAGFAKERGVRLKL